jgi:hypothetical protein
MVRLMLQKLYFRVGWLVEEEFWEATEDINSVCVLCYNLCITCSPDHNDDVKQQEFSSNSFHSSTSTAVRAVISCRGAMSIGESTKEEFSN